MDDESERQARTRNASQTVWPTQQRSQDGIQAKANALADAAGVAYAVAVQRDTSFAYNDGVTPVRWKRDGKVRLFPPLLILDDGNVEATTAQTWIYRRFLRRRLPKMKRALHIFDAIFACAELLISVWPLTQPITSRESPRIW